MTMRVRFFGDFSVHVDGESLDQLSTGKIAGLFHYLLLNRGHTVSREKLYEVLWPGREPSATDSLLKVTVHALRQVLKQAGPGAGIAARTNGYVLRADDVWLDVDEFEVCLDGGRIAEDAGDRSRAMRCYRQAVELYRGDLLASETADWVTAQRECDRALVLYALSWLRADALRRGNHPEVITLCRRIIEIDPYHEETYQTLMLAHGRRGELGQVRNWHKLCVRRLHDDLDVAPTATTSRIYSRAVRGELRVPVAA